MGHTDGMLERENHPDTGSGVDHRVRRLDSGLGSDVPGFQHGWTLVSTQADMAHKLPGASGSYISAENVYKEQCESVSTAQVGQHFSSGLYKQSGRNNLKETRLPDSVKIYGCGAWKGTYTSKPNTCQAYRTVQLTGNQGE